MKAAVIEHYGSPEEFKIKDLPRPEIKEGQILIQNKASSVNPIDTLVRKGKTKLATGLFGDQLLGSDFSGIVLASKSSRFKAGDEVFGLNNAIKGGSYAEEILADEEGTMFKPQNISFTEAAVMPLVSITAWQALVDEGKLKKGNRVLILGCTGGVGVSAVQIAKSFDAIVAGTCSSKHIDFAKKLGCDQAIDYNQESTLKDEKFDLIFDASGNFTISDWKDNLTEQAMFVSTRGGTNDLKGSVEAIIDLALQKRMKIVHEKPNPEDLQEIKSLIEQGKLKPYIAKTFPLTDLGQAHQMAEDGGFTGKIAIEI